MTSSQERWNRRYQDIVVQDVPVASGVVDEATDLLPSTGQAIDLAGGVGDTALWLAEFGFSTTLAEVSDVALSVAAARAVQLGLELGTRRVDLESEPVPEGPWDLITCSHYLHRPMLRQLRHVLKIGGVAVVGVATTTNLERHERPSARFLLAPDELPLLLDGLTVIRHLEDWAPWGVHEARIVARRER